MRFSRFFAAVVVACLYAPLTSHAETATPAKAQTCPTDPRAPLHTPTVELSTRGGATYGTMQYRTGAPLGPKEIALTFDDGPNPEVTPRVLDILDRHCIKATFFMVGIYAAARPDLVREVAARGHYIGTHTWDHPNNLRRLSLPAAKTEITKGFAAAREALASAPPESQARLAPFFRFPGLNDKPALISWLGQRDIATVSCDFGADDWLKISPAEVERRGLRSIDEVGRGILILHDTREHTADMLSDFIVALEKRGYRFVQIVPDRQTRELAEAAPGSLLRGPEAFQ
ncbi:MAG TPA: polysaccharide deacetylase family protein [Parvibaculum sp.]